MDNRPIHRDANEAVIIREYECYGALVWRLACTSYRGLPDLWVNPREGRGFFVEVKTPSGELSEEQRAFQFHTPCVKLVRAVAEVRDTLGRNPGDPLSAPNPTKRAHLGSKKITSIRQRQHPQLGLAIWQWREDGAEVWVLELLDYGLPHFWVKPPDGPGFFAHIGAFGTSPHQRRFDDHNDVHIVFPKSKAARARNYPQSGEAKAAQVEKSSQSGCLVMHLGLFAFALLLFFYGTMVG